MFRHLLSHNGIPHLLIALLLFGFFIYVENSMQAKVNKLPVISIASHYDDSFEETSTGTPDLKKISEKISLLLQLFTDDNDAFYAREENPEVHSLSKQEKLAMTFALARSFYAKHRYRHVIESLDELSYQQRLDNHAQFMYAFSLSKISKRSLAIKEYQLLITHQPQSQAATLNLGILLKKETQCEQAIPVFLKSVSISSGRKKAKGLSGLASCYYLLGQYEQAIKYYKKSIEYRPDSAQTWVALAKSYDSTQDNFEQALDAYNKGIALDARNFKTYLLKAEFQIKHFDYLNAISTLEYAHSFSNHADIHGMMIWLYIEQARRSKANRFLAYLTKNALSNDQRNRLELLKLYVDKEYERLIANMKSRESLTEEMQYLKGIAYRKIGYYKSAMRLFNPLVNSNEFGWRSKIQIARITRSRKQYEEANRLYENLLTHNSNAAFLWFESALVHEKTFQPQSGLLKIKKAIQLRPENIVYKLVQARLLKLSGDLSLSVSALDSLLSLKPNYIRALRLKSKLFSDLNEIDKLIKTYKHLLKLTPDDYVTIEKLAATYISLNKDKPAQKILTALLDEQSHNIQARYLLARSYYQSNQLTKSLNEIEKLLRLDKNNDQAEKLKQTIMSTLKKAD